MERSHTTCIDVGAKLSLFRVEMGLDGHTHVLTVAFSHKNRSKREVLPEMARNDSARDGATSTLRAATVPILL